MVCNSVSIIAIILASWSSFFFFFFFAAAAAADEGAGASSSPPFWSIETWCRNQPDGASLQPADSGFDALLSASSRRFLHLLDLPTRHPFCPPRFNDATYPLHSVPPQGPLRYPYDHLETWWDVAVTAAALTVPPLWAMLELWLRLLAAVIAPLGVAHLLYVRTQLRNNGGTVMMEKKQKTQQQHQQQPQSSSSSSHNHNNNSNHSKFLSAACLLTVASSAVLLTDTLYVQEYGWRYGASLLAMATLLGVTICRRQHHDLPKTALGMAVILGVTVHLVYNPQHPHSLQFGAPHEHFDFEEGLYFDGSRDFNRRIVDHWPVQLRTYDAHSAGATPWMPTGDARTGLPFLLNKNRVPLPTYHRVWLPVGGGENENDTEVVALDIAFPTTNAGGHSTEHPVYLVLHGLNGGSHEEYVKQFVLRQTSQGSTCIVMVARGLMDLPVRGYNVFHGARWEDADAAARALRRAVTASSSSSSDHHHQLLAGVGFSMGGIILANMVARTGADCALDAAVSVSGGLDMREELQAYRAMRLWQPLLTEELRQNFVIGKWGERVRQRLTKQQMKDLMRATHVTDIDKTAVVAYNGFRDVVHYYSEMSLLGDVPYPSHEEYYQSDRLPPTRRIHNVSIPLLVVHALDDPLITWRTVAANSGLMHPTNLTSKTGSGNLFLLLTKQGGHVGWPVGILPVVEKWRWMSDVSSSFVEAVSKARGLR